MEEKKYLIDGNWLICSEGTCMQRLEVNSQETVFAHSKLVATTNDRMGGNFYCLKMMTAGAMVGAIIGAAVVAGSILTGGAMIAGVLMAVGTGTLVGTVSGKLLSLMPCICTCLTKPGVWSSKHEKVLIQKQMALMPDAQLNCLLGGLVSIILPDIQLAIDALVISDYAYKNPEKKSQLPDNWEEVSYDSKFEDIEWENDDSGFKASLYYDEDKKCYILAFAGTENMKDWITDFRQGVGRDDKQGGQYMQAAKIAKEVKKKIGSNDSLMITGHSLGGGLATIASAATGSDAYTYNAAGLHSKTLNDNNLDINSIGHVQSYYSTDDPLNMLQNNRTILGTLLMRYGGGLASFLGSSLVCGDNLPQVAGEKIGLETNSNILEGHFLHESNLLDMLKSEKERNPDVCVIAEDNKKEEK